MKNENALIEIINLNYKEIFQEFNLTIEKEKWIAVSGTNCSGKSTLIKLLSTLISTDNTIFYKGVPIEKINKSDIQKEIGVVVLEDQFEFSYSTVEEELFSILENLQINQKEKIEEYQKVVKLLNMENILTENPNTLNRNSKIKLLLAATLISKPKVLLLDDICSMMTKIETKEILNALKELNQKEKTTIIMTTDNLNEVLDVDYLYILEKGHIALEGIPLEILEQDSKLNRLGLSIPFMVDLSVKLKDYGLIDETILDMDRMVEVLWK